MNTFPEFMKALAKHIGVFNDNPEFIEHVDDRKLKFACMLINQDGNVFRIRKQALQQLRLIDNLNDHFHHGYLDFDNPNDMMERTETMQVAEAFEQMNINPYSYRSDARDLLYLSIEPYWGSDDEPEPEIDNEVYTIQMLFSVYMTEDISGKGANEKKQRLYFHDYRYQSLLEKNLYYSTAKNLPADDISTTSKSVTRTGTGQVNNYSRSKPTGEIIQDIFRSTFQKTDISNRFAYDWDFGDTEMLYTSPSNFHAIDDLNYILDRHVSTGSQEPCILKLNRYSDAWSLLPISTYFQRSKDGELPGVWQSEAFYLTFDGHENSKIIPSQRKTFDPKHSNMMINYHLNDLSFIDDYTFVEMNGTDCQLLLNSTAAMRYSDSNKQFNIDLVAHNISSVMTKFKELYSDKAVGAGGGPGAPGWLTDTSRIGMFNFDVFDSWSENRVDTLSHGRNRTLAASVLLGNSITFTSKGDSSRRAGVWITVGREYPYISSDYDNKIEGSYLVSKVEHIIKPGSYENRLIGVKPYIFEPTAAQNNDIFYRNTNEVIYEQ